MSIGYIITTEVSCFWGVFVLFLPDLKSSITVPSRSIWSMSIIFHPISNGWWKSNGCLRAPEGQSAPPKGFLQKELLERIEGPSSSICPQHCKLWAFALVWWELSLWWSSCCQSNFCLLLLLVDLAGAGWQLCNARREKTVQDRETGCV